MIVPKEGQLIITSRRVIPYDQMKPILRKGDSIFIEGLKRQTAHSAAKKLTKELCFKIRATAAMFRTKDDDYLDGYAFMKED